ncbi:hypothetical protein KCU67_g6274, partial [Aureobasidium melanogenum]
MAASIFQSIAPATHPSNSAAYVAMPGAATSSRAPMAINTGGVLAATSMGLTLVVNGVTYPRIENGKERWLEQENAFLPGLRTRIDDLEAELKREKSRGDQLDKMNTALQNSSKSDTNSLIQERDAYKQQADDLTKKADELDHGQEISSGF